MRWIFSLVLTILATTILVKAQTEPEANKDFITQHEVLSASAFFVIVVIVWLRRQRNLKV